MSKELAAAHRQIESLAWRLARAITVCDLLSQALAHPSSPEITKAALAAHRLLFIDYPEPQPPPQVPC